VKGILMIPPLTSVVVLALVGTLAACGSDDPSADAATSGTEGPQTYGDPAGGAQGAGPGGGQLPGAFGEIAAVQGRTLQVQNQQTGQVAVIWTSSTAITQQVAAALSDVTVGSCVMVGSDSGSADADTVAATTVGVSPPMDGACQGGFGGPGDGPSGAASGMPTGVPPSGAPTDGPRSFGGGAVGQVTAVSAGGFTVESSRPGSDETQSVTVTVSGDTMYSIEADADGSALEVGRCVQATGDADSTGAVTATRIGVSDPVDGECAGPMGGARGPGQ
jgi:hypothetical protein